MHCVAASLHHPPSIHISASLVGRDVQLTGFGRVRLAVWTCIWVEGGPYRNVIENPNRWVPNRTGGCPWLNTDFVRAPIKKFPELDAQKCRICVSCENAIAVVISRLNSHISNQTRPFREKRQSPRQFVCYQVGMFESISFALMKITQTTHKDRKLVFCVVAPRRVSFTKRQSLKQLTKTEN